MKTTKFIQLGEKKNGRIVKNEQWSIDEFAKLLCVDAESTIKTTAFDRLFKTKKYIKAIEQKKFNAGVKRVLNDMEILIDLDVKGKGSAKKKVIKKKTTK